MAVFTGLMFLTPHILSAQINKDLGDLVKSRNLSTQVEPKLKKLYLPLLPILGYTPANGFMLGVGVAPAILLDSASHTHISSGLANVQVTSKRQINFNFRHNIYFPHDRIILQGDWRVLLFSQSTFGLGIMELPGVFFLNEIAPDADETGEQPMRFTYIRVYETALFKLKGRLYGGMGLAMDYHTRIEDERLDLESSTPFYTSHYVYSIAKEFSPTNYSATGFVFKALFDSRDNAINAYKGAYVDVGFRVNPTWLGSTHGSTQLLIELRQYMQFRNSRSRLAFWGIGQFLTSGQLPYLALPSIGWDTYNRSGRGYIQGRFRGENMVYGEVEFRFPVTKNDLIGGVVFLNTISVDNPTAGQALLERFAFGYGAGLRFKLNKETRTNICLDIGLGAQGNAGLYFGLQEAF
jgi:Omp85 superfamily domain